MPPRIAQLHPSGHALWVVLLALPWAATPVRGQELQLQRDYPREGPYECPAHVVPAEPGPDERARAAQLGSDALQAQILGDMEGARSLLHSATEADGTSPDLAYAHARVLEDLGFLDESIFEYCRSIGLGAEETGIHDARTRLDAIYEIVRERISDVARFAFVAGIEATDGGLLDDAAASFSVSIDEAPEWPAPVYNRAVVYERLGRIRDSLTDYRRYLSMIPNEVDPLVAMVSERIGLLEGMADIATPSPAGALALGVLPGMGHYYSGRPLGGTIVLALAGGAVAAGFVVKEVTVVCVTDPPAGGECAPDDVHDRITKRPLLLPGLGVAAAVTVIGAVDALIKARRRRAEAEALQDAFRLDGPRLTAPTVTTRGGRIDLNLLRVTFR